VGEVKHSLVRLLPAVVLAAFAALAPVTPAVPGCAAAGSNHAAVLVEHADGSVVTRCVAFDADSISGEELLNRSGVAWSGQTFGGFGDAVCALDGEPARYSDCPGKDRYWAVFMARGGGAWQLANVGISTIALHDGDAEGFRYVPSSGVPTVPVTAAGVCAAALTTPTPPLTPQPMPTPMPPPASATRPAAAPTTAVAPPTTQATAAPTKLPPSGAAPTAAPTAASDATISATPPPQAPAPPQPGGPDLGLLAAAVAGGCLTGLALLRLMAARARP
jgi:hypothetical protein